MALKLNASQAMHKLGIYNDYYSGKLSEEEIKQRRREDLRAKHPDKGGDADEFAEANLYWDRVMKYLADKKISDSKKCQTCSGTGWTDRLAYGFQSRVRCPDCKGKGYKDD